MVTQKHMLLVEIDFLSEDSSILFLSEDYIC